MKEKILAINPGATSTKFAVYEGEQLRMKRSLYHPTDVLEAYARVYEQKEYRMSVLLQELKKEGIATDEIDAVVGRGGLIRPIASGTYRVNEKMLDDLINAKRGEHASNLGAAMAYQLAREWGVLAYIVDPVSVDEMDPVARISGFPDIARTSLSHALNMKAVARKASKEIGKPYEMLNLILVHLGTGISIAPHCRGRMIDVNNPIEEGPFSVDRCGGLPATQLMNLCYSEKYTHKQMKDNLSAKGGLYAYLGTKDLREVEQFEKEGHPLAGTLLDAMVYQAGKEIGAMAVVLHGEVDRIVLTGGMANSNRIVDAIKRRVAFIAPVMVFPGEEELESLVMGALRVLRDEEEAKEY